MASDRAAGVPTRVRPGVDALQKPALPALDVRVAYEDDPLPGFDDSGARLATADPQPEAREVVREGVGPALLAQTLAGCEHQWIEVGGLRAPGPAAPPPRPRNA